MTVSLDPSLSNLTVLDKSTPATQSFLVAPSDNQIVYCYPSSTYQLANISSRMAMVVQCLALTGLVLAVIGGNKLVGIEMMAVLQVAVIGVVGLDSVNPVGKGVADMGTVNGLNYYMIIGGEEGRRSMISSRNNMLDRQLRSAYLGQYFWWDYNIWVGVVLMPAAVGLACYILSKTVFKRKGKQAKSSKDDDNVVMGNNTIENDSMKDGNMDNAQNIIASNP